jgi:hypothetical protein
MDTLVTLILATTLEIAFFIIVIILCSFWLFVEIFNHSEQYV